MQILEQENERRLLEQIISFKKKNKDGVIIIYGPTATGKTSLSIRLADLLLQKKQKVEIISSDSRQVYKYMNIGTDKISEEITNRIPHHLINIITPDQKYTAHKRKEGCKKHILEINTRGNIPFIVGGTGLYIDTIYKNFNLPDNIQANRERRAYIEKQNKEIPGYARKLLKKMDPDSAAELHPANIRYIIRAIEIYETTGIPKSILMKEQPVDFPLLMISAMRPVEVSNNLINKRVVEMIDNGLIQEVQSLIQQGFSKTLQAMNGIGYRQTIEYLEGKINKEKLIESIALASRKYAKRQRTRFRRYKNDALQAPKKNVEYLTINL